jgi:hypothetical protein
VDVQGVVWTPVLLQDLKTAGELGLSHVVKPFLVISLDQGTDKRNTVCMFRMYSFQSLLGHSYCVFPLSLFKHYLAVILSCCRLILSSIDIGL